MKLLIVIDMNEAPKKIVYHSTVNEEYALPYHVEDFFEQAGIKVDYTCIDIIADNLSADGGFDYKNFHFEMLFI